MNRISAITLIAALGCVSLEARKFYSDDPLKAEPAPVDVTGLTPRKLSDNYDFYRNTFTQPGEGNERAPKPYPAQNVNTLGEVPDGAWFVNRSLSHEEIVAGPNGLKSPPDTSAKWDVISAKTEGVTPGFVIRDAQQRRYVLKFDPIGNLEMATGADVISARLLHAIGYWVPENYLVSFAPEQLRVAEGTQFRDPFGRERPMRDRDVTEILLRIPRITAGPNKGKIRAVASLYVPGSSIGPFKYYGRRKGDKNDFIAHEHRRELRGFHVVSAWLAHHDARSINSLDTIIEEKGVKYVRHYLIDFGSTLGSAAIHTKSAREGNIELYDFKPSAVNLLSFGLYSRDWERAHYPYYPSLGRIQWDVFDPEEWVPNYPNRAFRNRLPDDTYWAAKKIMRFTDADIRDVVASGDYSDNEAKAWLVECLIKRRDIIGRTYFSQVLPLDDFAIDGDRLVFEDLAVKYKLSPPQQYTIHWSGFDNDAETHRELADTSGPVLPDVMRTAAEGSYWAAKIVGADSKKAVTVYLRKTARGADVAGIERTWCRFA